MRFLTVRMLRSKCVDVKGGQMTPIDLLVETQFHRAAPGGMGGTKCAGNYSPVLVTQLAAKKEGFADVVYLDAKTNTYLEEVSSCNIFVIKGRTVRTPPLKGTILPGVTRMSIIQLLRDDGFEVLEEDISVTDACDADEVFTTGTAVVVSSVGSITYNGTSPSLLLQPWSYYPHAVAGIGAACHYSLDSWQHVTHTKGESFCCRHKTCLL
jgi:branched-subunit amino acid aminotransferase/4-amino-4-deoxychorismate lyase